MKRSASSLFVVAGLVIVSGCASSGSRPVDLAEPRRVVGTESAVRFDAEVFAEKLSTSSSIALKYDITNQRPTTILVADLIPSASYDAETQTVTIDIGTEIPGQQFLPRLIPIAPGERKSFSASARVNIVMPNTAPTPFTRFPNSLRLKLNFLGESKPFEQLIAIPEKAVHDPALADALFPTWVERNESVVTNSLPMRWELAGMGAGLAPIDAGTPASSVPARRRRRG